MNCTKQLTITGYLVKYVDLREPKPRPVHEEIYTVDKEWVDAMALLKLNVADVIQSKYERCGFRAFSVERIRPTRVLTLDLHQLWESAAPEQVENTDQEAPATDLAEGQLDQE